MMCSLCSVFSDDEKSYALYKEQIVNFLDGMDLPEGLNDGNDEACSVESVRKAFRLQRPDETVFCYHFF